MEVRHLGDRLKLIGKLVVASALLACGAEYRGDGDFQDRGWKVATHRYTLDLGRLCPESTSGEYHLSGLPATEFTVGFRFAGLPLEDARALAEDLAIEGELALRRLDGGRVFRHQSPLHEWVWTCAVRSCEDSFAYLKGDVVEEPLPGGGVQLHLVRGQVDGAWGSYFQPGPRVDYELRASLSNCNSLPETVEVDVFASGGGWK